MRQFEKPCLVSNICIEFEAFRCNGLMIKSSIVVILKEYAEFHPVCPEGGIERRVPRNSTRVVDADNGQELFQPATVKKLAQMMKLFSYSFLNSLKAVEGFILKNNHLNVILILETFTSHLKTHDQERMVLDSSQLM